METGVDLLLHAAFQHGSNSEGDHEVGDLQQILQKAWQLMAPGQRLALMADSDVRELIENEAPEIDYDNAFAQLHAEQKVVLANARALHGPIDSVYDVLVVAFPGFLNDTDVNGADLVDWVNENEDLLRAATLASIPKVLASVGRQDVDSADAGEAENSPAPR